MNPRPARRPTPARSDEALERLVAWADHRAVERAAAPLGRHDFDACGDLTLMVEPDGSRRLFAYDAQRRLVQVQEAGGTIRFEYDGHDRLVAVLGPATARRHVFDDHGQLVEVQRGAAGGLRYRYDEAGRVLEYRTAQVSCTQAFDLAGRVVAVAQTMAGVTLEAGLRFDEAGRLASMQLPGGHQVDYGWDGQGRLQAVTLDGRWLARWQVVVQQGHEEIVHHAGGLVQHSRFDAVDGRLLERRLHRGDDVLAHDRFDYDAAARVVQDGQCRYAYDVQGRLASATRRADGVCTRYRYDAAGGRLPDPAHRSCEHDYLFDAAGELAEVRQRGRTLATMGHDAKGRLAWMQLGDRHERYLYGPADELLAACDAAGTPLRLYVHTPAGCLAEVEGDEVRFLHLDRRGAALCLTSAEGRVLARHVLDAFGAPIDLDPAVPVPWFGARRYVAELGLYRCGARWYDPAAGRFITPDSYTAAPDDERLMNALVSGAAQVALRERMLPGWLRHPGARQRHAFCAQDPVNRVDPNGHWSFGGVLLSLLGAIWTLPNTLFGLLIEITCLVGEVVRWLAWLFSGGHLTWATPGFDVASSGRLDAFALVFRGGWIGSFRDLLGITFGNVFFVHHDWENLPELAGGGTVRPPAYDGRVELPLREALYEHELRHVNQYGWFGPFFHLGLPVFGVYLWDVILHGYHDAWLEQDARDHGGF